jgi:hypothetical protein
MAERRRTTEHTRHDEAAITTDLGPAQADVDLGPWGAPSAIRTPYYGRVRQAWRAAVARREFTDPQLALALHVFARDARAREIPVSDLL